MNELLKENLGIVETGVRYFTGALLLAFILISSSIIPAWVALIAVYPVVTAIMAWDPVYAAIHVLRLNVASHSHSKMKAITVG